MTEYQKGPLKEGTVVIIPNTKPIYDILNSYKLKEMKIFCYFGLFVSFFCSEFFFNRIGVFTTSTRLMSHFHFNFPTNITLFAPSNPLIHSNATKQLV